MWQPFTTLMIKVRHCAESGSVVPWLTLVRKQSLACGVDPKTYESRNIGMMD